MDGKKVWDDGSMIYYDDNDNVGIGVGIDNGGVYSPRQAIYFCLSVAVAALAESLTWLMMLAVPTFCRLLLRYRCQWLRCVEGP